MNNNGYILVKDKDGQFKYFKDGKFFSIEEVKALQGRSFVKPIAPASPETKRGESKPAPATFEDIPLKKPVSGLTNMDERRLADQKIVAEKANGVIERLKIKFSDDKIKTRFVNVLITYFRGIRTKKEVEYVLTLPKISGGLELPPDKAKIIIAFLENLSVETSRERKNIVTGPTVALAKVGASNFQKENYPSRKITDFEHQLEPAPPAVIKPAFKFDVPPPAPKPAPAKIIPKQTIIKPQPATIKPIEQAKPKMADIKQTETHLVGPLEELGEMDLENFRRLGKNPKEIIDEVLEKVELLSEQSFAKRLQGVKAWKGSPIFQMYLSMNMEGILQGKSISDVIKARQIENKETLTLGEYETINEISRKISS
ncbi:MAG: hypothetical protein V1928_03535 [Parcubacteria group bacterium]